MNIYTPKKCRGIINLKKLLGIVDYIPATIPPLSIPVFPQPFIDNWLSTRTGNLDKNAQDSIFKMSNENCWVPNALNLLQCSQTGQRNGCLIQPQVVQFASHYPMSIGQTVRFGDGSTQTVKKIFKQVDYNGGDLGIAILNYPVNTTPAYLFNPQSFPTQEHYSSEQCANQRLLNWKCVYTLFGKIYTGKVDSQVNYPTVRRIPEWTNHYQTLWSGCSGSPGYLLLDINGIPTPVFIGTQYVQMTDLHTYISPNTQSTVANIIQICQAEGVQSPTLIDIP